MTHSKEEAIAGINALSILGGFHEPMYGALLSALSGMQGNGAKIQPTIALLFSQTNLRPTHIFAIWLLHWHKMLMLIQISIRLRQKRMALTRVLGMVFQILFP